MVLNYLENSISPSLHRFHELSNMFTCTNIHVFFLANISVDKNDNGPLKESKNLEDLGGEQYQRLRAEAVAAPTASSYERHVFFNFADEHPTKKRNT